MAGTPPNGKSWVSSSWREYVLQLADDIQQMQQYMPLLELAVRDTSGGSGSSNTRTFPARIFLANNQFNPDGCNYICSEVVGPRGAQSQIDIPQDPDQTKPPSIYFDASNTYEEGLICDGDADNIVIPPSFVDGCFTGLSCSVDTIVANSIVTMHAMVCEVDDNFPCSKCLHKDRLLGDNVFYWFSAVVQPCLGCGDDEGDGDPGTPTPPPDEPVVYNLPGATNNRSKTSY